jgi:predicted O-methyltransferase YrrM
LHKASTNKINRSYSAIKKQVLSNTHAIDVTDFGKGSKIFKDRSRPVNRIAKIAGISDRNAMLLNRIVDYFRPKTILELGTSIGLSSVAMALENPQVKITTVEGCPNTAHIAQQLFKTNNLSNIRSIVGRFEQVLPPLVKANTYDLIFIDGNHSGKACLSYFQLLVPATHEDTIVVFDDINWSRDMQQMWKTIQSHDMVRLTVDTYFWGIVFFRTSQAKQHFTIRV